MVTPAADVISSSQAAARLGVSVQSVRTWAIEGKLANTVRTPLGYLYDPAAVAELAAQRAEQKAAAAAATE